MTHRGGALTKTAMQMQMLVATRMGSHTKNRESMSSTSRRAKLKSSAVFPFKTHVHHELEKRHKIPLMFLSPPPEVAH